MEHHKWPLHAVVLLYVQNWIGNDHFTNQQTASFVNLPI